MRKPTPRRVPRAKSETVDARGEATLTLEGVAYRLRPSRQAVTTVEDETGMAVLELVRLGNVGGLSVEALGIIAAEFIKAGAAPDDNATRHVGAKQIGDLIYEEGILAAQATLTLVMLGAATGGRKSSGELRAATA